jgi:hypothetical protein
MIVVVDGDGDRDDGGRKYTKSWAIFHRKSFMMAPSPSKDEIPQVLSFPLMGEGEGEGDKAIFQEIYSESRNRYEIVTKMLTNLSKSLYKKIH